MNEWKDAEKESPTVETCGIRGARVIGADRARKWVREVYYSAGEGWHNAFGSPEIVTDWMHFPESP